MLFAVLAANNGTQSVSGPTTPDAINRDLVIAGRPIGSCLVIIDAIERRRTTNLSLFVAQPENALVDSAIARRAARANFADAICEISRNGGTARQEHSVSRRSILKVRY